MRNDEALERVATALVAEAKALGISTDALPAIAPAQFGRRSLRMDAAGQPPIFELTYFERGLTQALHETSDENEFVAEVMRTVRGLKGMSAQ